ncbi:NYN domain-containing protein [Candidatus Bipolaricaulota bacterium]
MKRVVFLVDGFNLYHSLIDAARDSGDSTKWLNLRRLCTSFLPLAARVTGAWAEIASIHYFSASPTHRSQGKIDRHALYARCLSGTGVTVHLGRFKRKSGTCPHCGRSYSTHEEKETDVAIASMLFEVLGADSADVVILMTGDTDLAPAARTCKQLFPDRPVFFGFPYRRANSELRKLAPESFSIKMRSCLSNQFPDPLVLGDGSSVSKPRNW